MSQERFFIMLEQVPRIKHLWNQKKKELDINNFEVALGVMATGEIHMAKFFVSLWFNDNKRYGFDLVDAVSSIDAQERALICEWIADPFWP